MKKIMVVFTAVLFLTLLIAVWLYANDSGKQNKAVIKDHKVQKQDTTKINLQPKQKEFGSLIPYQGEPGGDRVEDSYRFFEINKDRLHLINPRQELRLKGILGPEEYDQIKSTMVKFDQVVNGVKVASDGYSVVFMSDGVCYSGLGEIDTAARNINTKPAISQAQAEQIAFNDSLNLNTKTQANQVELLIAKLADGSHKLVWSFYVGNDKGGSWKYLIDAQTGKILQAKNALIY